MNDELVHTQNAFFSDLNRVGFSMEEKILMIQNNEIAFESVLQCALSQQQPEARLCCWIITHYMLKNQNAISVTQIDKAIDFLPYTTHTGQTREILRWLTMVNVMKSEKVGTLLDFCLQVLPNNFLPVAIKIHAMTIIDTIAKHEPDIIPEFAAILSDIKPYQTVGGKNKVSKLLAKYTKQGLITNVQ